MSDASRQLAQPQLRFSVLGGFTLESANCGQLAIANRKACGLLAYLALNQNQSETRERLAGLLWSDRAEEQARASLRQSLKQLRLIFDQAGFCGFVTGRQDVSLLGDLVVDLVEVADSLELGEISSALSGTTCMPERILYGFEALDQSFAAWLHVVRQKWHNRFVDRLQALLHSKTGLTSRRAAEVLVAIDPTHEEAHRTIIRHFAAAGNTPSALRQYKILWELLDEEYDMEPDGETQSLIADIKTGDFQAPEVGTQPSVVTLLGKNLTNEESSTDPKVISLPVVGVGDFVQGGRWTGDDYVVSGFRRELVAALTRFREWIVLEANNIIPSPVGQGGVIPSLDYHLEGTYFEEAETVHVVITLKEQLTQRYVWSEHCTLGLENWFAAQVVIVRRIAVAMNVYLSTERLTHQIVKSDIPFEAYSKWLKGQHDMLVWSTQNQELAEVTFREIIATSPSFAPAYSSLAAVHNTKHIRNPGLWRMDHSVEEALKCSRTSVDLDPLDTRNHLALAWSNAMAERYDQAELHFNMAHDLNPNSPTTLVPCAHGLSYCGDRKTARQLVELATSINPALPAFHWGYISCIRYLDRDFEGCLAASDIAQDVITDLVAWRAAAEAMLGDQSKALQTMSRFLSLVRSRWQSPEEPTAERITSWLFHCFPIRHRKDRDLLREGLQRAGLPIETSAS